MKELVFNEIVVRCDEQAETVWLSLNQMSALFGRDKSVVSRHLKNAIEEGELEETATVAKFATVQMEGGKEVEREIEHYNLEAILAVGYRVKSPVGTHFRRWATQQLKQILLGQRDDQDRKGLWAAYHAAKTGAVQLAVLAKLGVAVPVRPPATPAPRPTGRSPVPPAEFWRLLEEHWDALFPAEWLLREADAWCLDRRVVLARLKVVAPVARGWDIRALGQGLQAFGVSVTRRYFPGRDGGQFCWCVPLAQVPASLRTR